MLLDQPRDCSCDEGAEKRLHLPLIGVGVNRLGNGPHLTGTLSEHHFPGLIPDRQRRDLRLVEGQNSFGLSGRRFFGALFGKFDEIEVQAEACEYPAINMVGSSASCCYKRRRFRQTRSPQRTVIVGRKMTWT